MDSPRFTDSGHKCLIDIIPSLKEGVSLSIDNAGFVEIGRRVLLWRFPNVRMCKISS